VVLPPSHHFCIWCGKLFNTDEQRSREHIVPESLLGRLQSQDVCHTCNNQFGSTLDHLLLRNGDILQAAFEAGIHPDRILRRYEGTSVTDSGLAVRVGVRDGVSRPIGGLVGPELYAGVDMERPNEVEWRSFVERLKAKVRVTKPFISADVVEREVEMLAAQSRANPTARIYNEIIGEGLQGTFVSNKLEVKQLFDPRDFLRGMAKSLYTLAKSVLPHRHERACFPLLEALRGYAMHDLHAPVCVHDEVMPCKGRPVHRLDVSCLDDVLRLNLTLFGKVCARAQCEFRAQNPHASRLLADFQWTAIEDFAAPDTSVQTGS
jgi:hypothetical protein